MRLVSCIGRSNVLEAYTSVGEEGSILSNSGKYLIRIQGNSAISKILSYAVNLNSTSASKTSDPIRIEVGFATISTGTWTGEASSRTVVHDLNGVSSSLTIGYNASVDPTGFLPIEIYQLHPMSGSIYREYRKPFPMTRPSSRMFTIYAYNPNAFSVNYVPTLTYTSEAKTS